MHLRRLRGRGDLAIEIVSLDEIVDPRARQVPSEAGIWCPRVDDVLDHTEHLRVAVRAERDDGTRRERRSGQHRERLILWVAPAIGAER